MARALLILFLLIPSLLLQARGAALPSETCLPIAASSASTTTPLCPCCALANSCCCSIDEPGPSRPIPAPAPIPSRASIPDFTAIPDWSGTPMPLPIVAHAVLPTPSFRLTHRSVESLQAVLCVWRT